MSMQTCPSISYKAITHVVCHSLLHYPFTRTSSPYVSFLGSYWILVGAQGDHEVNIVKLFPQPPNLQLPHCLMTRDSPPPPSHKPTLMRRPCRQVSDQSSSLLIHGSRLVTNNLSLEQCQVDYKNNTYVNLYLPNLKRKLDVISGHSIFRCHKGVMLILK